MLSAHLVDRIHVESHSIATLVLSERPGKEDSEAIEARKEKSWSVRLHDREADRETRTDEDGTIPVRHLDVEIETGAVPEVLREDFEPVMPHRLGEGREAAAHQALTDMYQEVARLVELEMTRSLASATEIDLETETETAIETGTEMSTDAEAQDTMTGRRPWRLIAMCQALGAV